MTTPRLFHCAFYFDVSAEDFILHAVYSDREAAQASLAELREDIKSRVVVEFTLEGLKKHLLDSAIEKAVALRDRHGFLVAAVAPKVAA